MIDNTLTLEDVKEQFCTADKRESLVELRTQLDDAWSIDEVAKLAASIGENMEKQITAGGLNWTRAERMLWTIREAFILGSLDMAAKMMIVNDMGYEALAGEEAAAQ